MLQFHIIHIFRLLLFFVLYGHYIYLLWLYNWYFKPAVIFLFLYVYLVRYFAYIILCLYVYQPSGCTVTIHCICIVPANAAKTWNALSDNVVSGSSVDSFRHQLQTFLFQQSSCC